MPKIIQFKRRVDLLIDCVGVCVSVLPEKTVWAYVPLSLLLQKASHNVLGVHAITSRRSVSSLADAAPSAAANID